MDEVTWIEVLARPRDVALRQRITADQVRIGRAYDNDVVIDDPHVAPHHLRLVRGADGGWIARDLDSVNGLFVAGEHTRTAHVVVQPGMTLRIGATDLRLRHGDEAVAAELPLLRATPRWPAALLCIVLVLGLGLLDLWLGETGEPKLIRYLTPLLSVAALLTVWTAAWSVVSKVLTGHARFGLNLLIVAAGLLAYSVFDQLDEFGAFALSWTALARYGYVAGWVAFAGVCLAHLYALGPTRLVTKAIAVVALAAIGVTMQSLKLAEWRSNFGQASTLQRLEPPSIRLVPTVSGAAFFVRADALKAELDKARTDEPASGDGGDGGGAD